MKTSLVKGVCNAYVYSLIGIKIDGSDDTVTINASCETEAEIIIETFHDGPYRLLSEPDYFYSEITDEEYEEMYKEYLENN